MAYQTFLSELPSDIRFVVVLAVAALLGLAAHAILYRGLSRAGKRAPVLVIFDGAFVRRTRGPMRLLFPLLAIRAVLPLLSGVLTPELMTTAQNLLHVLLVAAIAWGFIALTQMFDDVVERRFDIGGTDNLRARRVRTQVGLLRQVLVIAIALFALGEVLMRFPGFQTLGTSLLASASVVGIIIGIAAQRPLANLVAGIQLALTQPIRVNDVVVIEGEWGTIEEITLTFVVVRIWDARRLVLPIAYFFEHPFQNWTRQSSQVIGTTFFYVDYTAPVAEIRAQHERIVRASPSWDGQVCELQVTDATERTMQIRAIMSAANATRSWQLRVEVREKLIDYLQRTHPDVLPRLRVADRPVGPSVGADM